MRSQGQWHKTAEPQSLQRWKDQLQREMVFGTETGIDEDASKTPRLTAKHIPEMIEKKNVNNAVKGIINNGLKNASENGSEIDSQNGSESGSENGSKSGSENGRKNRRKNRSKSG